jgi:alpha-L-fucosidase
VRLRIQKAEASPVVSEFGLYLLPSLLEEPSIDRDTQGMVTLSGQSPGTDIYYTLDGSQPNTASPRYTTPFSLTTGGTVRAVAIRTADGDRAATGGVPGGERSAVVSREFDIAPRDWRVISASGDQPDNLIKGGEFLGHPNAPVSVVIDLAQTYDLRGFTLKPLYDLSLTSATAAMVGPPARYIAWVGKDDQTWGKPAGEGEFANIAASRAVQAVRFDAPVSGRYLRLVLPRAIQDKPIIGLAGIGVLTR